MINTCSKLLIDLLLNHSKVVCDEAQAEVYIYGLECLINTGITLFIITLWGLFSNTIIETYCWIVAFATLRHHTGGLHAPTQFTCILSSCILCFSNSIIINYIKADIFYLLSMGISCLLLCYLFSPIDSTKLELGLKEKRKHKIKSLVIVSIGICISVALYNSISLSIIYSFFCACILMLIKKIIHKT